MFSSRILSHALTVALLGASWSPRLSAQEPPALTLEQKAVAEEVNAYIAAYNKGDAKALAAFFSEDAEWIDSDGEVTTGRAAIEALFSAALSGSKGRTLDLNVQTVRPLTADVLIEKGTTTIKEADGSESNATYSAVHVKKDGKWFISQLTETSAPVVETAEDHLKTLEWLVGDWVDKSEGIEVKATVQWTAHRSFLTRSFSVARDGQPSHEGTEVIGWDANRGKIRSWVFEADGSFSENVWTQDGRRWLIQSKTTQAGGAIGSAQHTLTSVSEGKFTWSSANRQVDGELRPDIDPIEIVRAK